MGECGKSKVGTSSAMTGFAHNSLWKPVWGLVLRGASHCHSDCRSCRGFDFATSNTRNGSRGILLA